MQARIAFSFVWVVDFDVFLVQNRVEYVVATVLCRNMQCTAPQGIGSRVEEVCGPFGIGGEERGEQRSVVAAAGFDEEFAGGSAFFIWRCCHGRSQGLGRGAGGGRMQVLEEMLFVWV